MSKLKKREYIWIKQDIKLVSIKQSHENNELDIISDEPLHTPFDFFLKIITNDIVQHIVEKTNPLC